MIRFASLRNRRLFCLITVFLTVSLFVADISDLREELQIRSCPYTTGVDDDITTGITVRFVFASSPILTFSPVRGNASVAISASHLPPCGFRAPPSLS